MKAKGAHGGLTESSVFVDANLFPCDDQDVKSKPAEDPDDDGEG